MKIKQIVCLAVANLLSANLVWADAPKDAKDSAASQVSFEDSVKKAHDFEKQNNYKDAVDTYKTIVAGSEKEKSKNLPVMLKVYNGLGESYLKLQNLKEADRSYRDALSCAVKIYGAGSAELIKPLITLAQVCSQEKNFQDAASHYKQALGLAERKSQVDGPEAVAVREKLAETYERSGNYKESEVLIKQSLSLREKAGDHSSPQLLALLNCYSDVLRKTERAAMADQVDYQVDQIHAGKTPTLLPELSK
ncbi:MAG TPA: tetratricopeptide repeat protein [Drouetiella sp.]